MQAQLTLPFRPDSLLSQLASVSSNLQIVLSRALGTTATERIPRRQDSNTTTRSRDISFRPGSAQGGGSYLVSSSSLALPPSSSSPLEGTGPYIKSKCSILLDLLPAAPTRPAPEQPRPIRFHSIFSILSILAVRVQRCMRDLPRPP
jgi:hypothetical protein